LHRWRWLILAGVLALVSGLAGCGRRALLSNVQVRPDVISPNADGKDDVAQIKYTVAENTDLSIYFLDQAGKRYDFRVNRPRSISRQTYIAMFGGAIDGRLLPDGIYTCVIEAKSSSGASDRIEQKLTIQGGDPERIEIRNLTIGPNEFTPNRDGIKDRVTIGYYLTKKAARLEVFITDSAGIKYPVPADKIREPLAKGNHEHDYDAGIDLLAAAGWNLHRVGSR
jgi:hypothetical protein